MKFEIVEGWQKDKEIIELKNNLEKAKDIWEHNFEVNDKGRKIRLMLLNDGTREWWAGLELDRSGNVIDKPNDNGIRFIEHHSRQIC